MGAVLRVVLLYLAAVNALAYLVYWLDKRRARTGGRRVPERELLLWVVAGGAPGAWLAMRHHRHKTRKTWFRAAFLAIVVAQVAALWLFTRGG
jgi:uncharacterized membrane protein YsdA (DUF1294 family)